jgi:Rrf2 family protein
MISSVKRDSKLSGVLHVLVHMLRAEREEAITSEKLAELMATNPVVLRRIFAGLRDSGFVSSEKGHGGGWRIACDPAKVTLAEIYRAVGSPALLAIGHRTEVPGCLIEQSVNAALARTFEAAEVLVSARLQEITLADLVSDVDHRWQKSTGKKERKHV